MKLIILTMTIFMGFGCASKKNYKATDYANSCASNINGKSSHLCLPIDTYDNKMKFHKMRPSEMRKMPTMSDVID